VLSGAVPFFVWEASGIFFLAGAVEDGRGWALRLRLILRKNVFDSVNQTCIRGKMFCTCRPIRGLFRLTWTIYLPNCRPIRGCNIQSGKNDVSCLFSLVRRFLLKTSAIIDVFAPAPAGRQYGRECNNIKDEAPEGWQKEIWLLCFSRDCSLSSGYCWPLSETVWCRSINPGLIPAMPLWPGVIDYRRSSIHVCPFQGREVYNTTDGCFFTKFVFTLFKGFALVMDYVPGGGQYE